jgi:hypothetical protein
MGVWFVEIKRLRLKLEWCNLFRLLFFMWNSDCRVISHPPYKIWNKAKIMAIFPVGVPSSFRQAPVGYRISLNRNFGGSQ